MEELQTGEHWKLLAVACGYCTRSSERQFRAHFGGPSEAIASLWSDMQAHCTPFPHLWKPQHLLQMLFFLKSPQTSWEVLLSRFNVGDQRTFKKYLWQSLDFVLHSLPEVMDFNFDGRKLIVQQINFDDRFDSWNSLQPSSVIDTFPARIEQPHLEPWRYWSTHYHMYCVKYEVICSFGNTARIVWLAGPFCGNANDDTITKESTVRDRMKPGERVLADKQYKNSPEKWICPVSGRRFDLPDDILEWNADVYSARQDVERLISRIKIAKLFESRWRLSLELHARCVHVWAKLTNLFLRFESLG